MPDEERNVMRPERKNTAGASAQDVETLSERLREARDLVEAIVSVVRLPLVVLDGDLRIESASPAFYTRFRRAPEETIGRRIHGLEGWDFPELRGTLAQVIERGVMITGSEITHEFPVIGATTLRFTARAIGAEGAPRRILLAFDGERSLDETTHSGQDDFLAVLSHELRAPLHAIAGWSSVLGQGQPDAETIVKAADVIERSVRIQTKLIEELLDMSRMTIGTLRLELFPVDMVGVVEAGLDLLRPSAESGDVRLESHVERPIPPVRGDSYRLQQVVTNLVSNAIQFTPRGGLAQVTLGRSGEHVRLMVRDTGRGIAPELLPFIFDRFRQAEPPTGRTRGGLGLGLAIVRHLVEQHGGWVKAESAGEGRGATFIVDLPVARPSRSEPAATSAAASSSATTAASGVGGVSPLRGLRVLVVDDEEDARELLLTVLAQYGGEAAAVASAAEALMVIQRDRPDLVVSDIGMPHEDGYMFLRKLRALSPERGGATPAVAVTAFAREEDARRAREAGYQMHLAKPVDPTQLVQVLAAVAAEARGRHG